MSFLISGNKLLSASETIFFQVKL